MSYYRGNAIYDKLVEQKIDKFKFVSGNAWQLIYGDANSTPLLLVYAFGKETASYGNTLTIDDKNGISFSNNLSKQTNIPLVIVQFKTDTQDINECLVSIDGIDFENKSMVELSSLFNSYGLPIINNTTAKYLNDKTSSAYHNWQRNSLGRGITVSDIDLYRVDENGTPKVIYELKRSYYSLERWSPFRNDYSNFKLISNLCNKAGLKFKIIYKVRHKSPFFDDPSELKLFSVNFDKTPPIILDGISTFEDFIL